MVCPKFRRVAWWAPPEVYETGEPRAERTISPRRGGHRGEAALGLPVADHHALNPVDVGFQSVPQAGEALWVIPASANRVARWSVKSLRSQTTAVTLRGTTALAYSRGSSGNDKSRWLGPVYVGEAILPGQVADC